ncbi:MAG: hypothetical protein Q7S40_02845 [Opitutaceae bacterium]|nr:hypothetical protein [Opitutaceae bacterium]
MWSSTIRNLIPAALFGVAMVLAFLPGAKLQPQRFAIELEIVSDVAGNVQVYFGEGAGFNEAFSTRAPIPTANEVVRVRLPAVPGRWSELRLDPLEGPGRVAISAARVVSRSSEVLRTLALEDLVPIRHVVVIEKRERLLDLSIPEGSDDPQLLLKLDPPLEIPPPWRQFATSFCLPAIVLFVLVLGILTLFEHTARISGRVPIVPGGAFRFGMAAAILLIIWGARLAVIDRFGSDLPYWDQWEKEGLQTFLPWFERGELWRNLFSPHNEHRMAPTVALNFALLELGGQWDARVQCVVNALLPAAIGAAMFLLASRRLATGWAFGFGGLAALLNASPHAWDNIIGGFQSQFHFLIGFSFVAMAGVLGWRAFSWRWWLAIVAGALSVVSMGSGFFWVIPVAAIVMLRFARRESSRRDAAITFVVAGAFLVAGWLLREPAAFHEPLHARSAAEFLRYAVSCLAWPLPKFPAFAILVWAPWASLLVIRFGGASRLDRTLADVILAAGSWVLLQAMAVAYARGGLAGLPAVRYGDVFILGPLTGFGALAAIASCWRGARVAGWLFASSLAAATAMAVTSALTKAIPMRSAELAQFENSVRDFVRTDDFATFEKRPLPFPSAHHLALLLRHPAIKSVLPASVRPPIRIPGFEEARPPEPAFDHRRTRFVAAPAHWESPPVPPSDGWWKIETSGAIGQPGVSLELEGSADRRMLASIAPSKPPGESWRAAYVHAPSRPAVLVARADAPGKWLAFSEPIELTSLSYWAWRTAKQGVLILCLAIAAAMALLMLEPIVAGRKNHTGVLPMSDREQTTGAAQVPGQTP